MMVGGWIYAIARYERVRAFGVTIYNISGAYINGQLTLLNAVSLIPDFILFGEIVPAWENTSLLRIANKTVASDSFVSHITQGVLGEVIP